MVTELADPESIPNSSTDSPRSFAVVSASARARATDRRTIAPFSGIGAYPLHLVVMALLWGYIYTSWSIMGRLGMVSFGHGAFLGIGAYAHSVLLAKGLPFFVTMPIASTP